MTRLLQEPRRAERDFASVGTSATLKAFICGFWDTRKGKRTIAPNDSELSSIFLKEELPPWHTAEEHAYNVEMFEKSGFTGPLNWYRNFGRYEIGFHLFVTNLPHTFWSLNVLLEHVLGVQIQLFSESQSKLRLLQKLRATSSLGELPYLNKGVLHHWRIQCNQ